EIPALPRERWRDAVRAAAARMPSGAWVVAKSNELPMGVSRAHDLDFIEHPVLVVTRHGALFNSRGEMAAKLDGGVPHGLMGGRRRDLGEAAGRHPGRRAPTAGASAPGRHHEPAAYQRRDAGAVRASAPARPAERARALRAAGLPAGRE